MPFVYMWEATSKSSALHGGAPCLSLFWGGGAVATLFIFSYTFSVQWLAPHFHFPVLVSSFSWSLPPFPTTTTVRNVPHTYTHARTLLRSFSCSIIFKVNFPEDDYCSVSGLAQIRKHLPAGEKYVKPAPRDVEGDMTEAEECELSAFDQDREPQPGSGVFSGKASSAYDDERGGGGMGGPGVQCANQ